MTSGESITEDVKIEEISPPRPSVKVDCILSYLRDFVTSEAPQKCFGWENGIPPPLRP